MPKEGFKSITVAEGVYDRFFETFTKSRKRLAKKGVNSFAGYVVYMLEDVMAANQIRAKTEMAMEVISVDDDAVVIKDNVVKRVAELAIDDSTLFCHLCEKNDCIHVGFALSLPELYERGFIVPRTSKK